MKYVINSVNFQRNACSSARSLFLGISGLFWSLLLFLSPQDLKAQCGCGWPTVYQIGSTFGRPNMAAALAAYPTFNTIGNSCVLVDGIFDIEAGQTFTANGATFNFVGTGSNIRVNANATFNSFGGLFKPCVSPGPWLGIQVNTGGTLNFNGCQIDRAVNGIFLETNSIFTIRNSQFSICTRGLKINDQQTVANHTILQNEFYDCLTGIYLDAVTDVEILANRYFQNNVPNLTGIEAAFNATTGCRNVTVKGGTFIRQTRGVFSQKSMNLDFSGATFTDCVNGIYCFQGKYGLKLNGNTFNNNSQICIEVVQQGANNVNDDDFNIDGNTVMSGLQSARSCIRVGSATGTHDRSVSNNIMMLPAAPVVGMNGIEIFSITNSGSLTVQANNLFYPGGGMPPGGILIDGSSVNTHVLDNQVNGTGSPNANGRMPYHIRTINSAPEVNIKGNNLGGVGALLNSHRGISVENCPNTVTLCCNTLNNSNTGLYLSGAMATLNVFTTTFKRHDFTALQYNNVVTTNPQIHNGNNWSAATGLWDARFDGGGNVFDARYIVDPALLPNNTAKVRVNGLPNAVWFSQVAAAEETCATTNCTNPVGEREALSNQTLHVLVAPNPADQMVEVSIPANESTTILSLRDVTGRIVMEQSLAADTEKTTLETSQLNPGLYIIELHQAGRVSVRAKVMIAHQ